MTPPWHSGVATMRVAVTCGGEEHDVLWRRGALVLVDHDAADLAVSVLAGRPLACFDVLRSWRRGAVDAAPDGETPHAGLVAGLSSLGRWLAGDDRAPAPALPGPLRRLRELSLIATADRGVRNLPEAERRAAASRVVEEAVTARVRAIVEPATLALARSSRLARVVVDVDVAASAWATGRVTGDGAEVTVRVPVSWLRDVWLPGPAATHDGSLVLGSVSAEEIEVAGWRQHRAAWVFDVSRRARRDVSG